jgi:hypothetical protein
LPTWIFYVVPAGVLAVAFVMVGRRELRRAAERRRMSATVLRLELEEHKRQEHGAGDAGTAL